MTMDPSGIVFASFDEVEIVRGCLSHPGPSCDDQEPSRGLPTRRSPWIIIAGEGVADGTEVDEGAIHGHHSGEQPVSGAADSRSCAGRVSRVAGLGKVIPSRRR